MTLQTLVDAGSAVQRIGRLDDAVANYSAALRIDPECAAALINLSVILADRGNLMAAVACARRAIANVGGTNPFVLANLANVLLRMEHYGAAEQLLRAATSIRSDVPGLWHNLGLARMPTDPQGALDAFRLAVDAGPRAVRDLGLVEMCLGRWRDGLHHLYQSDDTPRCWTSDAPEWCGEDFIGKTILIHHEQGYGDSIQFCAILKKFRGARVIFSVPTPLVRLMRDSGVADEVVDSMEPPPDADFQANLMAALRFVDVEGWLQRPRILPLIATDHGHNFLSRRSSDLLTIGVCWAGSPTYARDKMRSMPFEDLLSIADIPGVRLISLQKGAASADIISAGASPLIHDAATACGDFADLATVISRLDLVVSVDTAVLHLAGGLGIQTIGVLPYNRCWRWGRGTDVSPFYRSMKLVTQESPGDWVGVMVRVRQMIAEILEGQAPKH